MDKKKLIGTIIGVAAFAALVAGATYAWLTFGATVTNGNYLLGSMNFSVAYTKGTAVTSVPIVSSPTTSNTSSLSVVAKKTAGSAPGTLTINLYTDASTSSALLQSGALHYTVCNGTCSNSDLSQVTGSGTVTATGSKPIYTGTLKESTATDAEATYTVYFWLDDASVTNQLIESQSSYTGYISASAIQTDS